MSQPTAIFAKSPNAAIAKTTLPIKGRRRVNACRMPKLFTGEGYEQHKLCRWVRMRRHPLQTDGAPVDRSRLSLSRLSAGHGQRFRDQSVDRKKIR
jgi:hypothetical protein